MRRRSKRWPEVSALALAWCAVLAGCGGEPVEFPPNESKAPRPLYEPLALDSQDDALVLVAPEGSSSRPMQFGTGDVNLDVTTVSSGSIEIAPGPGDPDAFRFPTYVRSGVYPRAVITVSNAGSGEDVLSPGDRPFTWGAVFKLDDASRGRSEDNGDNLIQRGLYSESALYKAEVDENRGACTVKGSDGVLTVRTPAHLRTDTWYVLECEREGTRLRVQAWELGGDDLPMSSSGFGEMGTVRMSSKSIPISIGGKVSPTGRLVSSDSDQFNGVLAEGYVQILGAG